MLKAPSVSDSIRKAACRQSYVSGAIGRDSPAAHAADAGDVAPLHEATQQALEMLQLAQYLHGRLPRRARLGARSSIRNSVAIAVCRSVIMTGSQLIVLCGQRQGLASLHGLDRGKAAT